jgi:hypothetical protein
MWRGLVTIVELIDRRPYIFLTADYGRLIYSVIYMSDRLLTLANPNPHLPPPPELRRSVAHNMLRSAPRLLKHQVFVSKTALRFCY